MDVSWMSHMVWLMSSFFVLALWINPAPTQAGHHHVSTPPTGFYADNGLQQTVILENHVSNRRKKEIRQEILTLLGLHHRPMPLSHTHHKSAPRYMLELYNTINNDEGDRLESLRNHRLLHLNLTMPGMEVSLGTADLIMSFVNQVERRGLPSDDGRLFFFDSTEVSPMENVKGAELRMYKHAAHWLADRGPINIRVFRLIQGQDPEDRRLEQETNHVVAVDFEGWLDLDVTGAVRQWTMDPRSNLGLYIRITDANDKDYAPSWVGLVDHLGPEDKQAFMVAFFKAEQRLHIRKPRSAPTRKEKRTGETGFTPKEHVYYSPDRPNRRVCQMRQLSVNFRDLGWQDWIIAPDSYPADYCDGECSFPLNTDMNATNHAIVQTLVHLMNPYSVPKPCCAPTKLSAISVLHYDDNSNVILKKFQNMVVKACGCH